MKGVRICVIWALFVIQIHSMVMNSDVLTDWRVNVTTQYPRTESFHHKLNTEIITSHVMEQTTTEVTSFGFRGVVRSSNETPLEPIVSSCVAFMMDFSEMAASFTRCSILYARPFRFCEHCIEEYLKTVKSYHNIMKGTFHDDSGVLCSDVILNSDRIQIVVQTFRFVEHLWKECHCDSCFHYESESVIHEISNETQTFLELANKTMYCFSNYTDGFHFGPLANSSINPAVCESCREDYRELNVFYEHLLVLYPDNVCMDIVDMMNSTRLQWSKELHCSLHNVDITPVILLSVFFCSLPVLFYVSNKIHGTKTEKKLLKQKRMRESQMNCSLEEEVTS